MTFCFLHLESNLFVRYYSLVSLECESHSLSKEWRAEVHDQRGKVENKTSMTKREKLRAANAPKREKRKGNS